MAYTPNDLTNDMVRTFREHRLIAPPFDPKVPEELVDLSKAMQRVVTALVGIRDAAQNLLDNWEKNLTPHAAALAKALEELEPPR